jgi:hypothetical protein
MSFGADDLNLFFADMGVPVTAGAEEAIGLLDIQDVEVPVGEDMVATGRHPTLRLRADALPSLERHQTLVADGVTYQVRDIRLEDDGKLKLLLLVEVTA